MRIVLRVFHSMPVLLGVIFVSIPLICQESSRQKLELSKPIPLIIERNLGSGGALRLDMNVGKLHVQRNPDAHKIELKIAPQSFDDEHRTSGWVKQFDVQGDRGVIRLELPKANGNQHNAEVTISVPAETALKVELGVGELAIEGVRGEKELSVGVGQLTVAVASAEEYGPVEASVTIGDVRDEVFHKEDKGGFFRTEKLTGRSSYPLKARVGIGQVLLKSMASGI